METQRKLLIGTGNAGKVRELTELLADVPYQVISLEKLGIDCEVDETGSSFEENAVIKATTYSRITKLTTIADDSGLEVDVLGGDPGVYSARYAGKGVSDTGRIEFLLSKLKDLGTDNLAARFRCVAAIAWPEGRFQTYNGLCEGTLTMSPRGTNGFGYDSIFIVNGFSRTMAELSDFEKNDVSHRAMAIRQISDALIAGKN